MTDTRQDPPGNRPASPIANAVGALVPHRSAGLKLLLVCGLALLMAIPALFVFGVVQDRSSGASHALSEVSQKVGGPQSVLGPVLALPYTRTPNPQKPDMMVHGVAIAYAEEGHVTSDVAVEERARGIYLIPVFTADMAFTARFDPDALRGALPRDASPVWSDARIYFGVSDNRGIGETRLRVNNASVAVEPAPYTHRGDGGYQPIPASGVTLAAGDWAGLQTAEAPFEVELALRLTGAQRLAVGPFAKSTTMSLASDWDSPSFTGGILPAAHNVSEEGIEGFTANWSVPYLARNIPGSGALLNLSDVTAWDQRDMAVRFMREANPYQSVQRALKYAAMFVGFVFLAYFLFEIASGLRAHPAQYVLVGLAQAIFYLLLLALSERIGFDGAFLVAAMMTVALTAAYAASVFRSLAYGLRAFAVLSGIYALIFVLMRAEDHALLAGAFASFAAIALTMWMTRNIDWYGERDVVRA